MRRNDDFSLFTISGIPYLLPFGQGIADQKRGLQINDTGVYLWELLDRERTEEELLSLCAAHYEVSDSQLPQLQSDLQQFFHMLDAYGILNQSDGLTDPQGVSDAGDSFDQDASDIPVSACHANAQTKTETDITYTYAVNKYLSIGGLTLLLKGSAEAFSKDFDAFEIFPDAGAAAPADIPATGNTIHVDQTVTVIDHEPVLRPDSKILLKNHSLSVMENDLQYIFLFPAAQGIYEARLTKDGTDARYYCRPPYTESLRQDLFHAIRLSFLYLAQLHDMIVLHSASLLYRDRAWLFSGHSGAGKSTHTNLWKKLYDVSLINGDLNLLSINNGQPMVHGLPWCGTSGIVDTRSYPLGGIILIKKALQNHTAALDDSHGQLLVTQRLISPNWTKALMQKNISLVARLAPHILICRLHCTKEPEAAETAKQAIDDYLKHCGA